MQHVINVNRKAGMTGPPRPREVDHVVVWDDVSENVRAIRAASESGKLTHMSDYCFTPSWIGRADIQNWSQACSAVEGAWPDGISKMEELLVSIERQQLVAPHSIRRAMAWRCDEGDFDFNRYADGEDCWRGVLKRDVTGQQFVTILVQIGANGNTSADSMLWRGAVAIALSHLLEDQGYSCEIMAFDYGTGVFNSGRGLLNACWIKRAYQYLDKAALTNAISAWYFRLISFASYGLVPGQTPSVGFGCERSLPSYLVKHLTPDENYWLVEGIWSIETAIEFVKSKIKTLSTRGYTDGD